MVLIAATLESVFAYCLGCTIFNLLMRIGVIPAIRLRVVQRPRHAPSTSIERAKYSSMFAALYSAMSFMSGR